MNTKWIEELGVQGAAASIAPAVRTGLGLASYSIVCFENDESLDYEKFSSMCEEAQVSGVFSGDQEDANLQSIYDDIWGYANNGMYENENERDCEAYQVFGVASLGFFCVGDDKNEAEAIRAAMLSGSPFERSEIRRLSGRLERKISIVTGSAQGFGAGIAERMVIEGSCVVFADLNEDLARENAATFNRLYGPGRALAVKVDVSDEASVKNLVEKTVLEYGGLDIFISNAGVLKAGGLEEMTVKDFEFVTKINYTAFFICTKYAARPMRISHRFDPYYTSDIIQINSKSGLEGSNKNFAYAGGKFGGIGLVQSFAKELVTDGIKVNAICPGNYYEGPLWSDPERGLFVQYLNAGKIPGAKTVEDVKKAYVSKVPMQRGCYPSDVACAIFYCVDQKYETGQAIPVTGGQNMLK